MATFAPASSGFGAVGSAHVWGARGRWFESSNPDTYQERLLSRAVSTQAVFLFFVYGGSCPAHSLGSNVPLPVGGFHDIPESSLDVYIAIGLEWYTLLFK